MGHYNECKYMQVGRPVEGLSGYENYGVGKNTKRWPSETLV